MKKKILLFKVTVPILILAYHRNILDIKSRCNGNALRLSRYTLLYYTTCTT